MLAVEAHSQIMASVPATNPSALKFWSMQSLKSKQICRVFGSEQVFNVGSSKLSIDNWLTLARRVNTLLADEHTDGIVITHGTDTLEENSVLS